MTRAQITLLVLAILILTAVLLHQKSDVGKKINLYVILIIIGLFMIVPFYWMFVMATHATKDIFKFPPPFFFGSHLKANYQSMSESVNVFRSFGNSVLLSTSQTVFALLFCSMGGYAFTMYNFPGKKKLFAILVATMMIPWTATVVPWYYMMSKFGWINSFKALIVPNMANAFGIFWMKQYCQNNVPTTLLDAAKIDGCPEVLIFFKVIMPILTPAYAALGIMLFVNSWNDFMQPMLILKETKKHTLPLMLKYLIGDPLRGADIGALMLASALAVLPLLIVFLMASKFFMSGLTEGAIKG